MGLISLFTTTRAKISQMDLDVSVSESHEAAATLSQSEIEQGDQITDNVTLLPIKLTIEGVISKTPLNKSALIGSAATALGGAVGAAQRGGNTKLLGAAATVGVASVGGLVSSAFGVGDLEGVTDKTGRSSREPSDVWQYLLELRDRRQPFTVVTALRKYDNMILTSVSAPRSAQNTGAFRFTATMEQVKFVSAQQVALIPKAAIPDAAKSTPMGKQGPTQGGDFFKNLFKGPSVLSNLTGIGA